MRFCTGVGMLLLLTACSATDHTVESAVHVFSSTAIESVSSVTQSVTVTRVVDGDTIDVRFDGGSTERVRLIGIDAPESYNVKTPECFARESSDVLQGMIEGHSVTIT